MAEEEDDGPLWKEILTNEILWAVLAAILILGVAFHLATSRRETKGEKGKVESR